MEITMRNEIQNDYRRVEELTREAFWDIYKPGCEEHLIVHKIRRKPAFIPELDFVALQDQKIVGSIVYSKAKVIDKRNNKHEVISFGPISVLPSYQNSGIGSALITHTKKIATRMGYHAIVIFGNPAYYHRFGFKNADVFGITTSEGQNFDAFMALELYENSLRDVTGKFYEDSVFMVDQKELADFEKEFPYKEKHVTDTQLK